MLWYLCCFGTAVNWSSERRLVGIIGRCAEIHPLRRPMGGRSLAGVTIVRYLHKLVHTSHDDLFVHRVRGNRIEFCRTLGLWCEYWCVAAGLNHLSGILDVALGPGGSGAFYSYDGVSGSDRTTCSAARVSRDLAERGSATGAA